MAWPHPGGRLPNPGGYGSAYQTGGGAIPGNPWASGAASFANAIAGQLQRNRNFEQQKQLNAQKNKELEILAGLRGNYALQGVKERGNQQRKTQSQKTDNSLILEARKHPGTAMSIARAQFKLTGDPTKDAATHGSQLPIVQHKALDFFAKSLGYGGRNDPAFQTVQADEKFRSAIATGQPYEFGQNQPQTVATPDITDQSEAEGGTDNAATYP